MINCRVFVGEENDGNNNFCFYKCCRFVLCAFLADFCMVFHILDIVVARNDLEVLKVSHFSVSV